MIQGWSEDEISKLCKRLDILSSKGDAALKSDDKEEASLLWIGQFGDRFPKYNPPSEDKEPLSPKVSPTWKEKAPAILGGNPKG